MNLSERGIVDVINDLERDIGFSLFTQNDKGLDQRQKHIGFTRLWKINF